MDNEKRIIELNEDDLEAVSGGTALINARSNKVGFTTTGKIYQFKNCSYQQVRALCEGLIGQYPTEAEYDAACEAALKEKGWI